jgi:hypothetical protein|tara:strand:- start:2603 stop:2866 length:264 start_codon:yes stop_codon:yes gene_type:complete
MIDTDKYKGRTLGQWSVESIRDGSIPWNTADEELCADAPLLLAEVKRLRERLGIVEDFVHGLRRYVGGNAFDHIMTDMRKALGDEEE